MIINISGYVFIITEAVSTSETVGDLRGIVGVLSLSDVDSSSIYGEEDVIILFFLLFLLRRSQRIRLVRENWSVSSYLFSDFRLIRNVSEV